MANHTLTIRNFDPATETIGSNMNHTIVETGDDFRIRYDQNFEIEETKFDLVPGIDIYTGSLNVRLVYILQDIVSEKNNGVEALWSKKFVTIGASPEEIPFSALKPNRSQTLQEDIFSGTIKTTDGNGEKQLNDTRARYKAINQRLKNLFITKDVFDISTFNPTYSHPTVFALKKDDESAAAADDGKIRVFPLGGATSDQFEARLFEEDSPGSGTFSAVTTVPNNGWKLIVDTNSHEFANLPPKLYQVRVRDNSGVVAADRIVGRFEQIEIFAF